MVIYKPTQIQHVSQCPCGTNCIYLCIAFKLLPEFSIGYLSGKVWIFFLELCFIYQVLLCSNSEREQMIKTVQIQSKIVMDILQLLLKETAWYSSNFEKFTCVISTLAETIKNQIAGMDLSGSQTADNKPVIDTMYVLWTVVHKWLKEITNTNPISGYTSSYISR